MSLTGKYKTPRREERYPIRLPVVLRIGQVSHNYVSGDVSYRGIFVCTDEPPVLRQLITIEAVLPPNNTEFISHGMSVYTLHPNNARKRSPGVGIQFYAQSQDNRRIWEHFVDHARNSPPDIPKDTIDPSKRKHPRVDARFEVRPHDLDELETLFTRDISKGGMFLETDRRVAVGIKLAITIYHPITRRAFTIDSVVKRCSTTPRGVGLEFVDLSEDRRNAFGSFVHEGLAEMSGLRI